MSTETGGLLYGKEYHAFFSVDDYMNSFYNDVNGTSVPSILVRFMIDSLHNIFKEGTIQGRKLLDVGTGPSIISVISASRWFEDITLSDYSPQCRQALQDWMEKKENARNFHQYFDYVGSLQNDCSQTIEDKLRKSTKRVVPCDVTDTNILPEADDGEMFDAITSSLCLEAALKDHSSYENAICALAGKLREGGSIILVGVLLQTYYNVKENSFFTLQLSKNFIHATLEKSGFSGIVWYMDSKPDESSDNQGVFVVCGKKEK